MAFKFIEDAQPSKNNISGSAEKTFYPLGSRYVPKESDFVPSEQSNSNFGEEPGFLNRLIHSGIKGTADVPVTVGKILANTPGFISSLIGGPDLYPDLPPSPSESYRQEKGFTEEQFEPQFPGENFLQRILEFGPTAATGGVKALQNLATGAGAGELLGLVGAPKIAQDIAQLGTEIGLGIKRGKIPTPSSRQKELFEGAKRGAAGDYLVSKKLERSIKNVKDAVRTEKKGTVRRSVKEALDALTRNFKKLNLGKKKRAINTLNPAEALKIRTSINDDIRNISDEVVRAKPYMQDVVKNINGFFAEYGAFNPEFMKKLNQADKITTMIHQATPISDALGNLVSKIPNVGPMAKKIIGLFTAPINSVERVLQNIWTNPDARELYLEMAKATYNEDPSQFLNLANQFDALISPEGEIIQQSSEKPKKNQFKFAAEKTPQESKSPSKGKYRLIE